MRCPVDGTTLALAERDGVEIDYCPECRGIWLDREELDRIIERAAGRGPRTEDRYRRDDGDRHHDHHHDHDHDRDHDHHDRDHDHHDRDRRDRDHDDERGWGQRTGRRRGGPLAALGDLLGGGD